MIWKPGASESGDVVRWESFEKSGSQELESRPPTGPSGGRVPAYKLTQLLHPPCFVSYGNARGTSSAITFTQAT